MIGYRALMQGISLLAPSVQIQVLEVGNVLHPFTSKLLVNTYLKMVTLYPSLWRKIYHYNQNEPLSNWKKSVIYQLFHRRIEVIIDQADRVTALESWNHN